MQQSNPHSDGSRSFEQNNVGQTQVINNYFPQNPDSIFKRKGLQVVTVTVGILMLIISPFTIAYPPLSIVLAVSGLLLFPGVGRMVAGVFRIPVTTPIRTIALIALLLLNLPFAIVFGREKFRLAEDHRTGLLNERHAMRNEQQRKDSLDMCLQQIADFRDKGETDQALMALDKADLLTKTPGEKADVNEVRIGVSLTKATELMDKHQYNMAIDLLSGVYVLDTNDTEILYKRALCYVKTNHMASAVHDAKRAMFHGHAAADTLYEQINPILKRYTYTTQCQDGSFSSAMGRGACSHHGGVATREYPVQEIYRQYE